MLKLGTKVQNYCCMPLLLHNLFVWTNVRWNEYWRSEACSNNQLIIGLTNKWARGKCLSRASEWLFRRKIRGARPLDQARTSSLTSDNIYTFPRNMINTCKIITFVEPGNVCFQTRNKNKPCQANATLDEVQFWEWSYPISYSIMIFNNPINILSIFY